MPIPTYPHYNMTEDITGLSGNMWSIFYGDGNKTIKNLGIGASGLYLMSQGPTSAPSWADASGGGGGAGDNLGNHKATQILDMNNNRITGLAAPTDNNDAVRKTWVESNYYTATYVENSFTPTGHNHDSEYAPSGDYAALSGDYVSTSGVVSDYPSVSGDYAALSGDFVGVSGDYISHNHDDSYYTESELDNKFAEYYHTGITYHSGELLTSGEIVTHFSSGNHNHDSDYPDITDFNNVSGDFAKVSGDFVGVSGDFITHDHDSDYADITEFNTVSGDYAATSGDFVDVSGSHSDLNKEWDGWNYDITGLSGLINSVVYVNSNGLVKPLSLGASGLYLMSQGASSIPSWCQASGGGGAGDNLGNHEADKILDMNNHRITGLAAPSDDNDATRKVWVESNYYNQTYLENSFTPTGHNHDHNALINYTGDRHKLESEMSLGNIGTRNHSQLNSVGTNDHHRPTKINDTPTNGETTTGASSNWAYDHNQIFLGVSGDYAATSGIIADYQTVSGSYSNVSGVFVIVSGDYVIVSGDYNNLSGDFHTHKNNVNAHISNLTDITTRNHSSLQNIGSNDHHIPTAINDTPTNGETTTGVSSNWAYDHQQTFNAVSGDFAAVSGDYVGLSGGYLDVSGDFHTHKNNTNAHISNLTDITTRNHSSLQSIGANDHHIPTAINDTPTNGETTTGASSNWAYDHTQEFNAVSGDFVGVSGDYVGTSGVAASALQNVVEDLTPQMGGDLDTNEHNVVLDDSLSSDHSANGIIYTGTIDTNTVGFGGALHLESDGHYGDAVGSSGSTQMPCSALALGTTSTQPVLLNGIVRDDSWSFTPGNIIFVSSTSAGQIVDTLPSGANYQVQRIGIAIASNIIHFNPSMDVVEWD